MNDKAEIKNLILDYGNVIFNIDFNRLNESLERAGIANPEKLVSHESQRALFDNFETGAIDADAFRKGLRELAGVEISDEQTDEIWNSLLVGIPEGNHEVLLELSKKYRLFLLSNNNDIHYNWILQHLKDNHGNFSFDNTFEKAYFSQHMNMRKPNRDIFEYVLAENGLKPEETLFIDDTARHLAGAAYTGMHTLLMDDRPENLRAFLTRHNIL